MFSLSKIKIYLHENPKVKKIVGIILVIVGFIALVTPLTPGSWLIFVGLELLGIDLILWDRLKVWYKKIREKM